MKRILLLSVVFSIFILPQTTIAQLQWKPTGSFPGPISIIYFMDELNGFVSIGTAPGGPGLTPQLSRTSDGGVTWQEVTVDKLSTGRYGIQDIVMTDSLSGWACGQGGNGYSVWHTTDGGWTWNTAGTADHRYSGAIRVTAAGIVVSDFYNNGSSGEVRVSTDGGVSFTDVFHATSSDNMLGMDFSDKLHGVIVASFRSGNFWNYTTDGGLTWSPSNLNNESWSIAAEKGTSNFFAAPEGWSNIASTTTTMYRSSDLGQTWNTVSVLDIHGTGGIISSGSALYMQGQTYQPHPTGIFRSLDSGLSWQLLGGPGGFGDTRFAVCPSACHTNVIYASGTDHIIYKAYDDSAAAGGEKISGMTTSYQPTAIIKSGDTADVQINVKFLPTADIIGFIPQEVEFILQFDPSVITLSRFTDIIPPLGWSRKSVNIGGDNIDVTLTNDLGKPITQIDNFGSVGFFGLPPNAHNKTTVFLSKLIARNDCRTFTAQSDIEGGYLRPFQINSSGVKDNSYGSENSLNVFPNPSSNSLSLSFAQLKEHNVKLSIFDATGKIVLHRDIARSESGTCTIPIEELSAGSYTLMIDAGIQTSAKFVIAR